jgi:hypothetical protein
MVERNNSFGMSRRHFWQRSLLDGVIVFVGLKSGRAHAQSYKMTKKQAGYIVRDKAATQICAQCTYFISPNDCVIVQGPISPQGWCTYYGD